LKQISFESLSWAAGLTGCCAKVAPLNGRRATFAILKLPLVSMRRLVLVLVFVAFRRLGFLLRRLRSLLFLCLWFLFLLGLLLLLIRLTLYLFLLLTLLRLLLVLFIGALLLHLLLFLLLFFFDALAFLVLLLPHLISLLLTLLLSLRVYCRRT
jgi:hypothetical protein